MNIQCVKTDSKKFKDGLELVKLVLENNLLKDFYQTLDGEKVVLDMPNNFKLYYKKVVFPADKRRREDELHEGHIFYNNYDYLNEMCFDKKVISKKQRNSLLVIQSIWVYDVLENENYLSKELVKNKCSKKKCQYIHDNFWFKDFNKTKYGWVQV